MKKTFRKLLSLATVLAMILSLSSIVMADGLTNGKAAGTDNAKIGNTVTIQKEIEVYNSSSATVYAPPISYTYTVTAAGVTAKTQTVKDTTGTIGYVYPGVMNAVTNTGKAATLTFANTQSVTATTSGGAYFVGTFDIGFDPSAFTHTGIYRYAITQTTSGYTGVTVSSTETVRYLDVYVRPAVEADNVQTSYVIYGYVLVKSTNEAFDIDDSDTNSRDTTIKTNGFVHDGANNAGTPSAAIGVDRYDTYNMTLTKAVSGTFGDKSHGFPFAIAITSAANGARISAATTGTDLTGFSDTGSTGVIASGSLAASVKLADTKTVTISGIPAGSTISITETNDTPDIYKVSTTSTNSDAADLQAAEKENGQTAVLSGIAPTALTSDVAVTYTNALTVVSPTGLLLRIAPFGIMLLAGCVFIVIARKARKGSENA